MRIQLQAGAQATVAFSRANALLYATASGPNATLLATREGAQSTAMLRTIAR